MHYIVVDLGFGDAGKGTTVDWLCQTNPDIDAVIRFNGGAQAAHNVVLPDGRHHRFSQFGSGTFAGAQTILGPEMMVDLLALEQEANLLISKGISNPWDLMHIHENCLLTTPWHRQANQAEELARGSGRHGSCGVGIGKTVEYSLSYPDSALRFKDILFGENLYDKFKRLDQWLIEKHGLTIDEAKIHKLIVDYKRIAARINLFGNPFLSSFLDTHRCVFEGAQGVLLDEWWGFHPHTTWSTTTFESAEKLCIGRDYKKLGVIRSYAVRHGDGPMPSEDPSLQKIYPEPHNGTGKYMGAFRVGHFDAIAIKYALEVSGGADALVITHIDRPPSRLHTEYLDIIKRDRWYSIPVGIKKNLTQRQKLTSRMKRTVSFGSAIATPSAIADALEVPIWGVSRGPTWKDKI